MTGAPQSISDRCYLLELPPELRLLIYSHLNLRNRLKLKHTVVLDKHGHFRVRTTAKLNGLLSICRTIRDDCRPLLYSQAQHTLVIDGSNFKNAQDASERRLRSENVGLQLLSTCTHIAKAHTLVVRVTCSGSCSKAIEKHMLKAIGATITTIDRSQCLEALTIKIPCGDWVWHEKACLAFYVLKFRGDVVVEEPILFELRLLLRQRYHDLPER